MRIIFVCLILFTSHIMWAKGIDEVTYEKEVILVRKIGHEIMRYAKDSTSAIKPIRELGDRNYLIEFNTDFAFVSDSLINIINREIDLQNKSDYVVKIHSCEDANLIFSYFISASKGNDAVSCMGRSQEEACYMVEIKFFEKELSLAGLWWLVILIPIIILCFYLFRKKVSSPIVYESNEEVGTPIGSYRFDYDSQSLAQGSEVEALTYKESKILRVLSDRLNEVVEREELQKQVWEEDGLMVGRSLDMFISKLRKKLIGDPNVQIKNIHGIGYKLIVS